MIQRPRRQFLQVLGGGVLLAGAAEPFAAKQLRGIFPIAQTPFTESNTLDVDVLAEQVRFLDRAHVHGCVWPQNASEWPTLTDSERLAGAEAVASTGKKLRPALVIGVQAPNVETAVKYAKHAEKNGADAIISLPLAGADTRAQVAYYQAIGRATGLPLFAQAVGDLSVDQLIEIYKAVPTLRYIKDEAGKPLERFTPLKEKSSGELDVFSGGGKTLIDEMIRGFSGCMPFACFADIQASAWDLWHEGKQREAVDIFGKASILLEEIAAYGLETTKFILCQRGVFKNYRMRGKTEQTRMNERSRQVVAQMLELMKPYFKA